MQLNRREKYDYYLLDDTAIVIRHKPGVFEKYIKGKGWVEDVNMVGIMSGHITDFENLTEEEADKIVNSL